MSNVVSSLVQKKKLGSSTRKLVMMYMADKASDDGSGIWVSKSKMSSETELALSTIKKTIKELISVGLLQEAGKRECVGGYTVDYTILIENLDNFEGVAGTSTRSAVDPVTSRPGRLSPVYPVGCRPSTRSAVAPKPSLEPSIEPNSIYKRGREEVVDLLSQWASREASESFVKYRRTHKSKSLSVTGAKRLANHLQEIFNAGHDPSDALGMAEERGWASVELTWYVKGSVNDRTHNGQRAAMGEDPAIDQITRVVGALQSSREYRN